MGWIFGKSKKKKEEDKKPKSVVLGYRRGFVPMLPAEAGVDDREGKSENDFIEMSEEDIAKTRFYGPSFDRQAQMQGLSKDVLGRTGHSNVEEQTVDKLNERIKITAQPFKKNESNGSNGSLGGIRNMVMDAIFKNAPANKDQEAQRWGKWLSESSRLHALLMPELNSELCRRDMKLDEDAKESGSNMVETTEIEENVERIDTDNKRIFIGDKKRMDDMSNWINSGQTREIDGEKYEIYWTQESYRVDRNQDFIANNYHTWTPEMKEIHEKLFQDESGNPNYGELDDAIKKTFFKSCLKKTRNKNKAEEEAKANAPKFRQIIFDQTCEWIYRTVQNRFFRLTSLMGLDFFKNQGNTIQFARDIGQENYKMGRVNRVITDSEWAHAQRMGYTGAGGHVHRVNRRDKFRMR